MIAPLYIRVLHFEQDAVDASAAYEALKRSEFGFDYKLVQTLKELKEALSSFKPDVVLSEYHLIDTSTEQVIDATRNIFIDIPFVLLTTPVYEPLAAKLVENGVNDYLLKPNLLQLPQLLTKTLNAQEESLRQRNQLHVLKQQQIKLVALFNNLTDAIMLLDSEGKFIYNNYATEQTTGYSAEELLTHTFESFLPPTSRKEGQQFFNTIAGQLGKRQKFTFRYLHKNGHITWAEGSISNLLNDPQINAIMIQYRDITERRREELLHQRSKAKLQTIFNNTKVAYVLIDNDYKVQSFNPLAKERYSRELNITLHERFDLRSYIENKRDTNTKADFEKVLAGGKVQYELGFDQKDGTRCWYRIDMFPVKSQDGSALGMIIASEDITNRKLADLEKEKITTDLLHHVKDLEQFAYIVSHNLRSPVANIRGLTQLLQDSKHLSSADFSRCLTGLTESAGKLDGVITDLNYILQTRKGVEEKKEHVLFTQLLLSIASALSSEIEKHKVVIMPHFEVEEIFTLKSYLYSILLNLISNAIKYRRSDKVPVISISTRMVNNQIEITVSDNGLGLDLELHGSKIFGLYKKFHHHIEGKGMGLYMVKTQVELLGGRISVDSKLNKGTTFTLVF